MIETIKDALMGVAKRFVEIIIDKPLESLVTIVLVILLAPSIISTLSNTFGIFAAIGFSITLLASFLSGKLVENPKRILSIFVGYVICSAAIKTGLDLFAKNGFNDPLATIITLLVIGMIWLRGNETKSM